MIKLFYYPRNASWAPHMLLRELNVAHELVLVDRRSNGQKDEAYLALNPTGRIPTLAMNEQVIFESGAICLAICEQFDKHNEWLPPVNSRAEFYQWLFYLTTTLQPELMVYFYPQKHTTEQASENAIKQTQENRVADILQLLDQHLTDKAFILGDKSSLVDIFAFMLLHWCSGFSKPPKHYPALRNYLSNLAARPAFKQVAQIEGTDLSIYD